MADPDLQIRRGGGGGGGHPDPELRGGSLKKKFRPFGPQFGLKIRWGGPPGLLLRHKNFVFLVVSMMVRV